MYFLLTPRFYKIIGVFLHPGKSHSLNDRSDSTPRILTLGIWHDWIFTSKVLIPVLQQQHHHDQQQQARGFVKHTVHGSLLTQEGLLASHQQSHHQNNSFPVGNSTTSIVSFMVLWFYCIPKIGIHLYTVHMIKFVWTRLFWRISETYARYVTSVDDHILTNVFCLFLKVAIWKRKKNRLPLCLFYYNNFTHKQTNWSVLIWFLV